MKSVSKKNTPLPVLLDNLGNLRRGRSIAGAIDLRLFEPPVPDWVFRVPFPSDSAPQSRMLGRLEAFLLS